MQPQFLQPVEPNPFARSAFFGMFKYAVLDEIESNYGPLPKVAGEAKDRAKNEAIVNGVIFGLQILTDIVTNWNQPVLEAHYVV